MTDFPQPPNRTNHNAIYGPIHDVFVAAKEGRVLIDQNSPISSSAPGPDFGYRDCKGWKFTTEQDESLRKCKSISASALLRKLRWSTLGLQFDWSKVCSGSLLRIFFSCISFHNNLILVMKLMY